MKKTIGLIGIIAFVAISAILMTACGGGGGKLSGTYNCNKGSLEFISDSKVVWSNSDNIIKKLECSYSVNGTDLRITDSFGIVNDLTIQDKKTIVHDKRGDVYIKR